MTIRIARLDLQARLNLDCPPLLVEALGSDYWADAHLPGALNIPADQVDRLAPRLLPDLDAEIVIYCSTTCQNSDIAARRLVELGYRNVLVYDGGKEDWIEHGLPVERGADPAEPSHHPVGRRASHAVSSPEVRRADGLDLATLDDLVGETAAGRFLPDVHRCLLRIDTPRWSEGWTAAATTHPHDDGHSDVEVAFRIASVTKMVTATALLVLADRGRCQLDDPTGRHLPAHVVDQFHDRDGTRLRRRGHTPTAPGSHQRSTELLLAAADPGRGTPRRRPPAVHAARSRQAGSIQRAADRSTRDRTHLHRHRICACRSHHRIAHRTAVGPGVPRTGARSGRDVRHMAREQQRGAPPSRRRAHDLEGQDITDMDPTVDWAGGGLVSTATDLAAFLRALTHGHLLSPVPGAR